MTPTNDENTLYLFVSKYGSLSFSEILMGMVNHFGSNIDIADFEIGHLEYHARHVNYDLYDSSDYDNYLVISRI